MTFPFDVYALAMVSSLAVASLSLPLWRRWCAAHGHVDDPGHRKIHREPTPLAGGLAVFTGLLIPVLLGLGALFLFASIDLNPTPAGAPPPLIGSTTADLFAYGFQRRGLQLAILFLVGLGMLLLGWIDDRYELRPAAKFIGQLGLASLVAASGVRITLFVDQLAFSYALTILWILTVTNAVNFMDNMNGLCTGLGAIASWCFAWNGAVQGQFLVATLGFLTCGSLLGFLPFNFPRASAFLGDAGSHLVGYLLALMAILPHYYSSQSPTPIAVLKPLLILGVVLGDLALVVVIRWRLGRPFYVGDTNHLSHRLVRRGWSRSQAVLIILLLASTLGTLSFLF
jgi:UDP-GlcNAc:undecaprenyl-phosphate/decaprenyl-phosphate GlcNAc-1-phosphate transferase